MKKNMQNALLVTLYFGIIWPCFSMSTGQDEINGHLEPTFSQPDEDAGHYNGFIEDEASTKVHTISFAGKTILKGVRRESDDSFNNIRLANISRIDVVAPQFASSRYPDKEFSLARLTTKNGDVIEDMLIARKVIVCSMQDSTNLEKAWFFYKLKSIIINHKQESVQMSIPKQIQMQKKEPLGLFNKAGIIVQQAGQAVANAVKKTGNFITLKKNASEK